MLIIIPQERVEIAENFGVLMFQVLFVAEQNVKDDHEVFK